MLTTIITHLTDVEGNLNYLQRWADRSHVVELKNNKMAFRQPKPDVKYQFVYGGDFCDKGPGDLSIGQVLNAFKKACPNQVELIAGNREIKNIRITEELDPRFIRQRLLYGPPAYWHKHVTPRDYVIHEMKTQKIDSISESEIKRFVNKMSLKACQSLYLKWMLIETMGSGPSHGKPGAFEFRRMELAKLFGKSKEDISDEDVTQNYIDSISPTGVITQYLKQAKLACIIGETLFLHGAVTPENMGFVPGLSDSGSRIDDAKEWIEALNHWYQLQIEAWEKNPVEEALLPPGHSPLNEYVIFNPKSIVTTNWYKNNQLAPIAEPIIQFLNRAGIYRVVSGHQPFSDFPLIIRSPSLEVIVGDTGYSDLHGKIDNRGLAIHNLEITYKNGCGQATIDAIRKNNSTLKITLPSKAQVQHKDDLAIGHFTADGRLIRPGIDSKLVTSQLDGFRVIDKPL